MTSEIEETAKAAQEIAKTASKAIEAGEKLGEFISKYIGGPIEQGMGIFEDKLKYMRWERQVRFMQCATELLKSLGLSKPTGANGVKPLRCHDQAGPWQLGSPTPFPCDNFSVKIDYTDK